MQLPLRGIIPPMVTPLLENMELDSKGLERLIEHLLRGGVHGIFLLGTNGEGPSLGYNIRKRLISEVCAIVDRRVPVLVSISDTSSESALEIAEHSKNAGADALVLASPYYFPISQKEMIDYLRFLAPKLPLPFLLYNIPSCTKLHLSLETIKEAKELGAIGIKDSSGDMGSLYTIIDEFKDQPDFSIIAGAELFLSDTIINGGHAAVAGGANIYPRLFVDLYEASYSKDLERVKELRHLILKMHNTLYSFGNTPTKSITAIKCALAIMGICSEYMVEPLHNFDAQTRKQVETFLGDFNYGGAYHTTVQVAANEKRKI
ncbi:dihydrodipicolinate synthase family protein [Flavobacteriaceae bacterium F89]|uniref:Dihydrodipicolinate synthase family protein n=1 Tax=Cerina litoralis TaxID=2874477 RepID=A0AAE3EUL7_9FLAO|nr:dihydrodipicolinate synthase family protein [Cerina litoralis]MCG2460434.1 dihydrodipicolinate synthase family protein [Cerina litoralis]